MDLFEDKTLNKKELKYKLYQRKTALDDIIKHQYINNKDKDDNNN